MKKKRLISLLMAAIMLFVLTSSAFADVNMGSGDGTDWGDGTGDNVWAVRTESGAKVSSAEGLRITVYDAESSSKVYNTIDLTGNANISAVDKIWYFADSISGGSELIPKTTWLSASYIGATYTNASATDKYNNVVTTHLKNIGYSAQYIAELANLTIISENNTANLEAIKTFIGKKEFIVHLCSLIPSLNYDDFAAGKYKIAFEPVAYFRYRGQNYAMTATEAAIYDKFIINNVGLGTGTSLKALLGPLTHSNLPRSAFLEYKDLGVPVYSPAESDYWDSYNYNTDSCIIRCMGIGIVGTTDNNEEILEPLEAISEYHTNTTVYTAVTFYNDTDTPYFGFRFDSQEDQPISSVWNETGKTTYLSTFDVYYSDGNTHTTSTGSTGIASKVSEYYLAGVWDTSISNLSSDEYDTRIANIREGYEKSNQSMREAYQRALAAWKEAGGEGDPPKEPTYLTVPDYLRGGTVNFEIKDSSGRVIKNTGVSVCCPEGEETTVYVRWTTPSTEQDVSIKVTTDSGKLIVDGDESNKIEMTAKIVKVKETPPPDPLVTDTRPSWHKYFSASSVNANVGSYARNNVTELSWSEWVCEWSQDIESASLVDHYGFNENYTYIGAGGNEIDRSVFHRGAVEVTGFTLKTYTVSMNAVMEISPADECKTATYSNSTGKYTMKSGYGIQINITSHLSGNGTSQCTGTQIANVLFPEFNYNRQSDAKYNRLLEKVGNSLVFKKNEYSTYNSRVHFTPIWFGDNKNYTVYAEVFDVWCPAGQLTAKLTDSIVIKGNVYDDWHVAPTNP